MAVKPKEVWGEISKPAIEFITQTGRYNLELPTGKAATKVELGQLAAEPKKPTSTSQK